MPGEPSTVGSSCEDQAVRRDPLIELPKALTAAAPNPEARFVMGVDGGATKTLAAVFDLREGVVHLGRGGSSNPDAVGEEAAGGALVMACGQALSGFGIAIADLDGVVLAMSGTDTEAIRAFVHPGGPLARAGGWSATDAEAWVVVNDVVGAWATATGASPGVGVIAGTGSNVLGVGSDSRAWRAGGWGQLLGDEGSGYWLATRSIAAALHERDGTGPPTTLSEAAVRFFGVQNVEGVASLVYGKPLSKGELAAFAAETAGAANEGDAVARRLYEQAARELGGQVKAAIRETGLTGEFPVGLIGGAFKAGAVYVEPLSAAINELSPQARVSVVSMAPVGGCLMLAARAAGYEQSLDAARLERLLDEALIG
jgi:N-acetylglucosamine kinase-like BadF-type ATPase